jgi:hypothetical protein
MPGLGSLAASLKPISDRRRSDVYLVELDSKSGQLAANKDSARRFQYFPESISDSKAINYSTKEIPGASLPLYQWVNSGARTISFTAVFTTDVDFIGESTKAGEAIGNTKERLKGSGIEGENVYIPGAIAWLRRYMLPRYSAVEQTGVGTPLVEAPPVLLLVFPKNARIARTGGTMVAANADAIPCLMQTCDVTYEQFFPNGLPRIATVSLSFAETAQLGKSVIFPQAPEIFEAVGDVTEAELYTYEPRHIESSDGLLGDDASVAASKGN